ncbi:MAG TPA: S53 family peptidase [Candidatus Eremiobacteraceae bacterium]|nr:S53 family peptidase [Candidatus Eremiobacteraceae bacterium]
MLARFSIFGAIVTFALGTAVAAASTSPIEIGTVTGVRDYGRASESTRVRVAVVLNYHRDAELESLTQAQADPASPLFHHFLTPEQFSNYFAATPAEYGSVIASLRRGGFTITHIFANRTVVDAVAPAPIAARYFSTDIHRVLTADGRITYTNVLPGIVPAEIGDLVFSVQGLDAVGRMRPTIAFSPRAGRRLIAPAVSPDTAPVFGPDGGYGPLVFTRSYDLPSSKGFTGAGHASGVATDADFLNSDLNSFLAYFRIKRTGPQTTRVLVDGGPPPGDGPDSIETTLDVEQITSLAPGTALYVYEVTYDEPTNANFIDIFNQVVSDDKVDTLNSSYGYCETAIHKGYPASLNTVAKQGNALGITFHSSAGDTGSSWDGCSGVAVGTPVDIPHGEAIGGTTLSVDGNGNETGEIGWNSTGGGISKLFAVPTWQQNVPHVIKGGRNLPDLAFDADPGTGGSYFYGGFWSGPIGGTSMSSPIFGASLTEINQVEGARAGDFNVTLYKTWLAHGYGNGTTANFRDITSGSIPPYHAGPGYDQMSGIGAMLVNNFVKLFRR